MEAEFDGGADQLVDDLTPKHRVRLDPPASDAGVQDQPRASEVSPQEAGNEENVREANSLV
jgi:hypothetical protein